MGDVFWEFDANGGGFGAETIHWISKFEIFVSRGDDLMLLHIEMGEVKILKRIE